MKRITLPLSPFPKPRMTRRDRWAKRDVVVEYFAWCDTLRALCAQIKYELPDQGTRVIFNIPMPHSWPRTKKAKLDGAPHKQKPDCDNLFKAFADALRKDDSGIWQIQCEKRWAVTGSIVIEQA
jgi:Holliday junction resolvase RusA-like endonuclease